MDGVFSNHNKIQPFENSVEIHIPTKTHCHVLEYCLFFSRENSKLLFKYIHRYENILYGGRSSEKCIGLNII